MSHGQGLAKNALWLMSATVAQKVVAFLAFTLIARLAGAKLTGNYFFAVSVTSMFVTLADFGLTPVIIREMASDEEQGRNLLRRVLWAKSILIPLAIFCSLGYAWLLHASPEIFLAVIMACFVLAADTMSLLWYGVLRGKKNLQSESIGMFVGQCLTAIIGVSAAYFGWGVQGLVSALIVGSTWNLLWSIFEARRLSLWPTSGQVWTWNKIFLAALPFGLAGLFTRVFSYLDSSLLQYFYGAQAVGEYAVAYKMTYALQFLPITFVAALYPALSSAHAADDRTTSQRLFAGSEKLMLLLAVPIAACLSALAGPLVNFLYGAEYQGSIVPLEIMPWVLIPIFLDFPVGSLLNATHRAAQKTWALGFAMLLNIGLNIWLIPRYAGSGAAIASIASFILLLVLGYWFVRREFSPAWLTSLLLRGLGASIFIWLCAHWLSQHMSVLPAILLAGGISVIGVLMFGLLGHADIQLVLSWFRKKTIATNTPDQI